MTAPALPIEKITAMLPRLASDHDGEIVATAKAIGRVLKGAGADWHVLTACIERGAALPPPPKRDAYVPCWDELGDDDRAEMLDLLLNENWLSDWERDFVSSIAEKHWTRDLTDKQIDVVDRLLARAFRERDR
jgi:hypothetical protein